MNHAQSINLQEFTKLPLKTVLVADRSFPDVLIQTPHRGSVNVALKSEHYPFLFGSVTQTEKHLPSVVAEIVALENEAKDYLLDEWLKAPNP